MNSVNKFFIKFSLIVNKIKLINRNFCKKSKKFLQKFCIFFITLCITFCSVFALSVNKVFAEHLPPLEDSYFERVIVDKDKGDVPGNVVYKYANDEFLKLNAKTQYDYLMSFLVGKYYFVMTSQPLKSNTLFESYLFFSDTPFYIHDVGSGFRFAMCDDLDNKSDNDFGFDYVNETAYISRIGVKIEDITWAHRGFGGLNSAYEVPTGSWTPSSALDFYKGNEKYRPMILDTNIPVFFRQHNGEDIVLKDNRPDVGEGDFSVMLDYDKDKFSNFKCSLYPDEEIKRGFKVYQGQDFTLTWKYKGRNCYIEYDDSKGEKQIVKPFYKDGIFGTNGSLERASSIVLHFKEGTGEWYDFILDFFESLFNGIYEFFKPILDFFVGIFQFLWDLLVGVFEFIFIPEDGFFEEYFSDLLEFINRKLGILIYPFTFTFDVLDRFLNIPNSDGVLRLKKVTIPYLNIVIFNDYSFNMKQFFKDNFGSYYNTYLMFVDAIIYLGLIYLARNKFNSIMK